MNMLKLSIKSLLFLKNYYILLFLEIKNILLFILIQDYDDSFNYLELFLHLIVLQ